MERMSWNEYFMDMAKLAAKRSTCIRRQVGAVAVKDNQVLATGYNGAPTGKQHCLDIGCLRQELEIPSGEKHELCRGSHAEMNVICQAAKHGTVLKGATLYCTLQPCSICAKLIVNVGIAKIVYMDSYPDRETESLLKGKLEKFNWEKPPILKQWGELAAKLKETKWAKAFKKDNPKEYFTALKLAIAKPCKVTIKRNRVTYNYSIQSVANPEFCMDIFTNRKNAEDLIKYMGWELVEKEI